jgi:hypothetical protein
VDVFKTVEGYVIGHVFVACNSCVCILSFHLTKAPRSFFIFNFFTIRSDNGGAKRIEVIGPECGEEQSESKNSNCLKEIVDHYFVGNIFFISNKDL